MRKLLFALLLTTGFGAGAQVFNNEWIDYAKTYYKFKVGKDGVHRISGASLAAAGLTSATAENLQLWRAGVQVPIYTSVTSGALSASDYIEFWGKMNDGKPDKELYRDPSYQVNDRWSLITDSATYFLTMNSSGPNLRLQTTANNVTGNTLPVEPYFVYTKGLYFKDRVNNGYFFDVGSGTGTSERLYSSSYDIGEGWTSADIQDTLGFNTPTKHGTLTTNYFSNLFPASVGPAPSIKISVSGNAAHSGRFYRVLLNGDSVVGSYVPYEDVKNDEATFNLSRLSSGNAILAINNFSDPCISSACVTWDNLVVHKIELTYPRQFNFGGETNFEFSLPASATGNYLEINNFSNSGVAPVLYDLTNGKRYTGEIAGALVKFVLLPSSSTRNLVLVNESAGNITSVNALQQRNFTNYALTANQGDYLIISNPLLFNGANGTNPVEEYRAYRSSLQGGSYNTKTYLEDQLIDQFGFGIKKNPAGIRNFILYARKHFSVAPRAVLIIGRGVHYKDQRSIDAGGTNIQKDNLEKLNLVPTFGWPASDMLLAAEPGVSSLAIPIGRLTAITPAEVSVYLKKLKETELAQTTLSPTIGEKAWMKNIAHIAGAGEEPTATTLVTNLNSYKRIIEDTLYGAKVSTFTKTSTNFVQQLSDADLIRLFNEGLSLITYYGHSSPVSLEFNLDEPANYNNAGKYPMFFALGCNAGNTFDYSDSRFTQRNYLSDKYVLAPDRGSINFIASTHFGIVHYLDYWNLRAYTNLTRNMYRSPIGEVMKKTIDDVYAVFSPDDFLARCNAEQTILNGDPMVRMNQQPKPDYAIVDTMVKVAPSISVSELFSKVSISVMNLGKAIDRPVVVETKRRFPDNSEKIRRDTLSGIRFRDTLSFNLTIDPTKDKGDNRITVTIDPDNVVDELFESNNSTFRDFFVFEDEAKPIYPYNYAIVNNRNITLKVSTANPFSASKQYRMEIDTTEAFNSPIKATSTVTAVGGVLEFAPGINFTDSTVYYWRVAVVPATGSPTWNGASFIYLNNSAFGFNQSHYYQHQKSAIDEMTLSPGNKWKFKEKINNLLIRSGVFATAVTQAAEFSVSINGVSVIRSVCSWPSLIVNVFDPNTFQPMYNNDVGQPGQFGSDAICGTERRWNFQYMLNDTSKRRKLLEFLESIPSGYIVAIRNFGTSDPNSNVFANVWRGDSAELGGRSVYHHLKAQGFTDIDSFYRPRALIFTYKKDRQNEVAPKSLLSEGIYDKIAVSADYLVPDSVGYVTSPLFGPAAAWKEFKWRGATEDQTPGDRPLVNIIGLKANGTADTLLHNITAAQTSVDISSINAATYPYLQLQQVNLDGVNHTPYQMAYWRLTYDPIPEGAVAPNLTFSMKDTVDVGEPLALKLAFKNISDGTFRDSMKLKLTVYDRNNNARIINVPKQKSPKNNNDVLTVQLDVDTKQLVGANTLYLDINPDDDQPEQYHFNNFIFKNFYVRGDTLNPLLDVTFDNVHILNRDIVSSKPSVLIKLKDEAKWMLLNDPSVATVQVRYPDVNGNLSSTSVTRNYAVNTDTLKFIPATSAANGGNTASLEFKPAFLQDGEYELIVTGKDMSENGAGAMSYRVAFQVINKAMISNMLNYPNPFTTSTAFVFTLTGQDVPQNIKVQILTVTGKVVREITKGELGPLHIGRNITEFKWDGTDQYGQKLANGVYLYRVVTNLNGQSLEKYRSSDDNTDKYFNKGYGKMYLMR